MKVKLSKKNYPKVISVLQNIFYKEQKAIKTSAEYDYKGFGEIGLLNNDERSTLFRNAKVKKHWLAEGNKTDTPLIHVDFKDGISFFVFHEGDIVDLKNGSTMVVRQQTSFINEVLEKKSLTTVFTSVDLDSVEAELIKLEDIRLDERIFFESENYDYD